VILVVVFIRNYGVLYAFRGVFSRMSGAFAHFGGPVPNAFAEVNSGCPNLSFLNLVAHIFAAFTDILAAL
jgi:hypothetical protein